MRRIILIGCLVFGVVGCAFLQEKKADIVACWEDVDCKASAISRSESLKNTTTTIVGLSPIPAAGPIAGSVMGYGALLIFLLSGGAALRKKKVTPV